MGQIMAWIVLGLIAGFIASKIVHKEGAGCLLDIVLGIVGAFIGGIIFSGLGATGFTGFNLWSLFVADRRGRNPGRLSRPVRPTKLNA